MHPVNSFFVLPKASFGTLLEVARSAVTETVLPLTPKTATSSKRREEAVKAMKRTKVENALDGVDAQMLELLSDQFLYPDTQSPLQYKPIKPRGRPDFVPGAMKLETMIKFQEQGGMMGVTRDLSTEASDDQSWDESPPDSISAPTRKASKVRGSSLLSLGSQDDLPDILVENKPRKRVVKNLPQRKDQSEEASMPVQTLKGRAKANNLELQKYYRTQLLTADEEYSLGIQIQLMIKCEQVHEGLAIELMRLPSIEEWAHACG